MANKKSNQKKPKQSKNQMTGRKGGGSAPDIGSPTPARKSKKKK